MKSFTVDELVEIEDGDRGENYPKLHDFQDHGYCLFLNTGNVTREGFSFEETQFISQIKDNHLRKGKLKRGDIIYTTRGTVGNTAYYDKHVSFKDIRINSGMVILRCKENVDEKYIYQLLKSNLYRKLFLQYCTGSAQPQLPIKNLKKIKLNIPDLPIQKRIADILSAYDDLIENNRKQIKLLEEAAQRLYKEWFVDLRFPGYENTKIVDGVPEGWRKGFFSELCEIKKNIINSTSLVQSVPYIGLEHMPRKDFCLSTWGSSLDVSSSKSIFQEGDILFGKIRPYFHKVGIALISGVASTDIIILRPYPIYQNFLLLLAYSDAFVKYTSQTCKEGAKMPRADWKEMEKYTVLIPNYELLMDFEEITSDYIKKIKKLVFISKFAQEARDRLLPKLMSGEIAV